MYSGLYFLQEWDFWLMLRPFIYFITTYWFGIPIKCFFLALEILPYH